MAKTASATYGLAVTLTDSEANAITMDRRVQDLGRGGPAPLSASEKFAIVANAWLKDFAKGAIMIPAEWSERIRTAIGTEDPSAIVEQVEIAVGKSGDATRVEWHVDPTQIQFYQQLADNAGVTMNHQLKSLLDYAYSQGWFGSSAPDAFKILLDPEQYRRLQELFGKDIVTGADVMEQIEVIAHRPFEESLNDGDLVLDSISKE